MFAKCDTPPTSYVNDQKCLILASYFESYERNMKMANSPAKNRTTYN